MEQTIYTVRNGAFCTEQASKRFNRALYAVQSKKAICLIAKKRKKMEKRTKHLHI